MNNLSNPSGPADHIQQFEQNLAVSLAKSRMGTSQPVTEADEAEMLTTTNTAEMVREVERRRDAVTQLLADTGGFEPRTGKRRLIVPEDSPRRRALEIELHLINTQTLPLTQQRAADIARRQAALPSAESKLQAEADRAERIHAAAIKRAEEMEIEAMALRLRKGAR